MECKRDSFNGSLGGPSETQTSQKESREFSATIFYSTAFLSVDNEEVFHEVLHESVCYL